jgi:hypothetical protein
MHRPELRREVNETGPDLVIGSLAKIRRRIVSAWNIANIELGPLPPDLQLSGRTGASPSTACECTPTR